MNILEKAIQHAGSVNKLAESIGVRQNVISNWRARKKVPPGWEQLLKIKYDRQPQPEKAA